jgi:integrase
MDQDTTPAEAVKRVAATPRTARGPRPEKPREDFPLFPHLSGQWAKKIRGKVHYFGVWADPQAALDLYLDQKEDLHAGRTPRARRADGLELRDVLNRFLAAKQALVDAGELAPRTWKEYHGTCDILADAFGKTRLVADLRAEDFEALRSKLAARFGPVALGNLIQRVRGVFKFAFEAELIPTPIRFGPHFQRPSRKVLRHARNARGLCMFEPDEFHKTYTLASVQLKAMLLLGVNCGFGGADCGTLPLGTLDLDRGWIDFPRPKTGVRRRCPLWPETVAALREVLVKRKVPRSQEDRDLVFVTKYGGRWYDGTPSNPISKEVGKMLDDAGVRRKGLSFYALRHTFETIGGAARDQPAVDAIMGHARDNDMASVYRERIEDSRLRAVVDHVHAWLFPPEPKKRKRGQKE